MKLNIGESHRHQSINSSGKCMKPTKKVTYDIKLRDKKMKKRVTIQTRMTIKDAKEDEKNITKISYFYHLEISLAFFPRAAISVFSFELSS